MIWLGVQPTIRLGLRLCNIKNSCVRIVTLERFRMSRKQKPLSRGTDVPVAAKHNRRHEAPVVPFPHFISSI
jgi:hypothetical protein